MSKVRKIHFAKAADVPNSTLPVLLYCHPTRSHRPFHPSANQPDTNGIGRQAHDHGDLLARARAAFSAPSPIRDPEHRFGRYRGKK